jgi:hypothetical protein
MKDDKDLRAVVQATIEAIILTMEEMGMDEKKQDIFLNNFNKYLGTMAKIATEKGGRA